jgi:Zn-dependent protease
MTDAATKIRGIKLGSIKGAAIVVEPSTLIMLVVLAFVYSSSDGGEVTAHSFSLGLLLAVLLFASVFIHELAHAIAAWSFGRKVSAIVLTLWGGHTSFDARNLTPRVIGVTAIAGPLANVVIATAAWITVQSGVATGTASLVVGWLAWANGLLAIFNVLPGIPLDGGKVLSSVVWAVTGNQLKGTLIGGWAGRAVAVFAVVFTIGFPLVRGYQIDIVNVVVAALLFGIIWPAASSAIHSVKAQERRESVSIGGIMRPAIGVPHTVSVATAREGALRAGAMEVVVLAADGAPAAIVSVPTMDRVPAERRAEEGLQSVSVPIPRGAIVTPLLDGEELIAALREWYGRTDSWAVVDGQRVVGVVRLEEVVKAFQ